MFFRANLIKDIRVIRIPSQKDYLVYLDTSRLIFSILYF